MQKLTLCYDELNILERGLDLIIDHYGRAIAPEMSARAKDARLLRARVQDAMRLEAKPTTGL